MRQVGVILLIVVTALSMRVWRLSDSDINPDEYHYIHEAERLWHGDPYISIRHHPFLHPQPNMGHPFWVQVVMATGFRLWGSSILVARLVSVVAGMGTVGLMLWFDRRLLWRTRVTGALLFAIVPLAVRFNRTAYLDSWLTLWTLGMGWAIWHYNSSKGRKKIFLVIAGVAAGLAVATKLSGVFALLAGGGLVGLAWWHERKQRQLATLFGWQLWFFIPGLMVSWLLNDPAAYWNAMATPADAEFQVLTLSYWMSGLRLFLVQVAQASWFLLGPALVGAMLYSLKYLMQKQRGVFFLQFLGVWLLLLGGFLWLQPKSEYAWLPILPPLMLLTADALTRMRKSRLGWQLSAGVLIATLPFTFWYGLRYKKLPYIRPSHFYNRTINDNFYKTVVERVNLLTPQRAKVLFLPQQDYPYFALRPDISWSYYGDESDFDVFVLGEQTQIPDEVALVETLVAVEDEQTLLRRIYQRR